MSLVATLEALAGAGGTVEQMLAVVRAHEATRAALDADRRERAKVKKAAQRAKSRPDVSPVVPGTDGDNRGQTGTDGDGPEGAAPASPVRTRVVDLSSSSLRSEEGNIPPEKPSVSTPKGAKRGSKRCPVAWYPAQPTIARLEGEGFSPGDLERALTRMRDHEFRTPHTDWDACFRNWVRNDADRKPRNERSDTDPKFAARQANLARAFSGAELAARQRWEP